MNGRFFITSLGLVAALATALVYGVGGSLAIDGVLTIGTLTALAGLLTQLYGPLTQLTNLRIDVMNALVSFDRVFEVLDLVPMIRDAEDARSRRRARLRSALSMSRSATRPLIRFHWRAWSRLPRSINDRVVRSCTMCRSLLLPARRWLSSADRVAARRP